MSDRYSYRPRAGFDIRIKPTKGGKNAKKSWAKQEARKCDAEGCDLPAEVRAAKSPDHLDEYMWFCKEHAREHNKNWNFFAGKSDAQAAAIREQARYGDRPTWQMSKNGRAAAAARAGVDGKANIDDTIGVFAQGPNTSPEMDGAFREGRKLTKLQTQAFKTLNLPVNASGSDIRKRYAELVKRFHPDSNEGDRGAEEQLREVIKAHQLLKKANFC